MARLSFVWELLLLKVHTSCFLEMTAQILLTGMRFPYVFTPIPRIFPEQPPEIPFPPKTHN